MSERQFPTAPAVRKRTPLFIGLFGVGGSGKTLSALRLAKGMQRVTGGRIAFQDTENGRGLHYADSRFGFDFDYSPFDPPFRSLDYLSAIQQREREGARILIVDSGSHEHEGIGGMLDYQEAEVERMSGGDESKRHAVQMLAWGKPKADRRKLLIGLQRLGCHLIVCFRAKDSSVPRKNAKGKTEVVHMGYVPIAAPEFVFEMTLAALLLPGAQGVPTWNPENPGERTMVKLPEQFRGTSLDKPGRDGKLAPLDEAAGEMLARWAEGPPEEPALPALTQEREQALHDECAAAAQRGRVALKTRWDQLTDQERDALRPNLQDWKDTAKEADTRAAVPLGPTT